MIKIFIAIVFFAELVITISLVKNIIVFNAKVKQINRYLESNITLIPLLLIDLQEFFSKFNELIIGLQGYVNKKREEYSLKFLKTFLIYSGLFLLRGKYKKALLAYQVIIEAYEGFSEA